MDRAPFPKCVVSVLVILMLCGTVFVLTGPLVFKYILQNKFKLSPNSEIYKPWSKTPFAIPMEFYMFNWTNPHDFHNSSIKPKFQELGPYRYLEFYEKSNITWNSNGTVTYRNLRFWHYDDQKENGNLEDVINIVNPITLYIIHLTRKWNYFLKKGLLSVPLSGMGATLNVTRTIDEMLFKGYPDPVMKLASSLPFLSGKFPVMDRVGFYYKRNGSVNLDGVLNMGTGINSTFGKVYSWNYQTKNPHYEEKCGNLQASAGDFFEHYPGDFISFWAPGLCRILTLRFLEKSYVENIEGNKYVLDDYFFDNGTHYPENKCFCNGECVPSGLLNISTCSYGAPMFVSLPHFLHADPYYNQLVDGLKPVPKKHEFFMTLDPITGSVLETAARLQVNALVQPVSGIRLTENIPKFYFPYMWTQHYVKIPAKDAFLLRLMLSVPLIFSAIGILMIVTSLCLLFYIFYRRFWICVKKEDDYLYKEQTRALNSSRNYIKSNSKMSI